MKKDEQAEPKVVAGGGDGVPELWLCGAFLLVGGALFLTGLSSGSEGWRPTETGPFGQGLMLFGGALAGVGGWLLRARNAISRLSTKEEICHHFNIDKPTLQSLAEARGIKPRYIVNGRNFYDLDDFAESRILLRASMEPTAQAETLLRPAAHSETPPELLLRAATTPETPEAPLRLHIESVEANPAEAVQRIQYTE